MHELMVHERRLFTGRLEGGVYTVLEAGEGIPVLSRVVWWVYQDIPLPSLEEPVLPTNGV